MVSASFATATFSRTGHEWGAQLPAIAAALRALPIRSSTKKLPLCELVHTSANRLAVKTQLFVVDTYRILPPAY
jgi:hypothetical protein